MKQMSLPRINVAVPKQNEGFVLTINEQELNIAILIGSVDFNVGMNTVEKYMSKALIKIIQDQKYLDFVKNEENIAALEELKPSGEIKNLSKRFGVRDSEALLYINATDLTFNGKSLHKTLHSYGDCELRKAFELPYIQENKSVMINNSNYIYNVDKLNSLIYFNYLNGEVYYSITVKSLLSELITNDLSLSDISVVF